MGSVTAVRRTVALGLVGLVLATGCSSGDSDVVATDAGAGELFRMDDDFDVDEVAEEPAFADDGQAGPPRAAMPVALSQGRRVIRTAELVLEVDEPAEAAEQVAAIAARYGGLIAESDLSRDDQGVVRGSMTLRVPSAELDAVVEDLDALASSVPVRRVDERDVTGETVDLEAQVRNLTAYEQQLLDLLADVRATTDRADDLLSVFERIRGVREEIDRLEARLAMLDDQVSLSTVHVLLRPSSSAIPISDTAWSPLDRIREALATTARALTSVADAAIWILLTALPVLLVITIPFALPAAIAWRRVRGRRPSEPGPPPPAQPAAPSA